MARRYISDDTSSAKHIPTSAHPGSRFFAFLHLWRLLCLISSPQFLLALNFGIITQTSPQRFIRRIGPGGSSDPRREISDTCALAVAYEKARGFHEGLRQAYERAKGLCPLTRYLRLRSLIKDATMEQRLQNLRLASSLTCACRNADVRDHVTDEQDEAKDLVLKVQNLLTDVRARAQSVMTCARDLVQLYAGPLCMQTAKTSSNHTTCDDHQRWRSRIVLLQRHLEKMRREFHDCQKYVFLLRRYKAMKGMLKHVLKARMDCAANREKRVSKSVTKAVARTATASSLQRWNFGKNGNPKRD